MAGKAEARLSVQDIRLRVVLPVVIFTLAAVIITVSGLYWVTTRSDAISVEHQVREAHDAFHASLDDLARRQEVVAIRDDIVTELRKLEPDWRWVDDTMLFWLRHLFSHDRFYLLDENDEPTYASHEQTRDATKAYDEVRPVIQRLVERVRGRVVTPPNIHERLPGQPLHPQSMVVTGESAIHATELVNLLGRPAAASVMLVVPLTGKVPSTPGREPLLVCIRFLDTSLLGELAKRNLFGDPHFSRTNDASGEEHAMPLMADDGSQIGWLIWKPALPGTDVMRAMAPIMGTAGAIMLFMLGLLGHSLYGSAHRQQMMMTELEASEAQAQHLAVHDVLTGLPNRATFNTRLDQALAREEQVTVLLLDLDRFKSVNDTLGHVAGDVLICEFGARLIDIVRGMDLVARLGGDEFAILCCGGRSDEDVAARCRDIIEAVRRPFNLGGTYVSVGISIGISTASADTPTDRSDLVRKADVALYRAKADGGDCYRTFRTEMDDTIRVNGEIETELREALETGKGLLVHYQPQVACRSGKIVGVEALVRWRNPTRGMVSPQQFIGIAEESGQICKLGEWVLREACRASRRWPELFMAVNFSPKQFRMPGFAENVIRIVREAGANPQRIEVEVTESVLLDDDNLVREALAALRAHGFRVALDDFGTGYSSLSYLRRFQVDKIKIDRSFVQPLYQDADAVAIVTAVLTLGHAMGLSVTAEGVENPEQHQFLTASGCDMMQGYLFSPAVPEEEIEKMVTLPKVENAA